VDAALCACGVVTALHPQPLREGSVETTLCGEHQDAHSNGTQGKPIQY
jgi:hypothetical protein